MVLCSDAIAAVSGHACAQLNRRLKQVGPPLLGQWRQSLKSRCRDSAQGKASSWVSFREGIAVLSQALLQFCCNSVAVCQQNSPCSFPEERVVCVSRRQRCRRPGLCATNSMEVSWYDLTQAAKRAANQFNDQHTQRQNYLHANPPKRPEASKASALGRRHMQELSRVVQQMSKAVDSGQCAPNSQPALALMLVMVPVNRPGAPVLSNCLLVCMLRWHGRDFAQACL